MNYSLWPACVKTHDFTGQLAAAKANGFDRLPVGGLTVRQLQAKGMSLADIRGMASEYGVALGHYDGFSDWAPQRFSPTLADEAKAVFDFSAAECLEICQELELDAICATGVFEKGAFSIEVLAESFSEFCTQAQRLGIRVDLEFIPMWSIPSLKMAWNIVRMSQAKNAGILLDTWHFCRGDIDMGLLRSLPAGVIKTVQFSDARSTTAKMPLLEECLRYRCEPGKGELPLREIWEILKQKGGLVDVGPEIFSDEMDLLTAVEAANRSGSAVRSIIMN